MKNETMTKTTVLSRFERPDTQLPAMERSLVPPNRFGPKRILVPLDFSQCSEKALQYAVPFARQFGAELVLVHVVQGYVPLSEFSMGDPGYVPAHSEETAQKQLCALKETLDKGINSRVLVRVGNPYTQIIATARELGIDLIILSTHGHTGLAHVFLGSTTERVVRRAKCPVLVVRENENEFIPGLESSEQPCSCKEAGESFQI